MIAIYIKKNKKMQSQNIEPQEIEEEGMNCKNNVNSWNNSFISKRVHQGKQGFYSLRKEPIQINENFYIDQNCRTKKSKPNRYCLKHSITLIDFNSQMGATVRLESKKGKNNFPFKKINQTKYKQNSAQFTMLNHSQKLCSISIPKKQRNLILSFSGQLHNIFQLKELRQKDQSFRKIKAECMRKQQVDPVKAKDYISQTEKLSVQRKIFILESGKKNQKLKNKQNNWQNQTIQFSNLHLQRATSKFFNSSYKNMGKFKKTSVLRVNDWNENNFQ